MIRVHKITLFICALALFGVGFFVGKDSVIPVSLVTDVKNVEKPQTVSADFNQFWSVWNLINDKYFAASSSVSQEKVWGAIGGLVDSLGDPHSIFFPPEDAQMFQDMILGSFGGVGMEVGEKEGVITVIAPLKGSPAERAGIRAGDTVVEIGATSTANMSLDEAVKQIRGKIGTQVQLTLAREGNPEFIIVKVMRENISIPTLDTKLRDDGIFVISLYNFDAKSSVKMREAFEAFTASQSTKLILDVRGNPGGFLDAAVDIASYFLPEGAIVVREKFDQGREEHVYRSAGYALLKKPFDMVVLVDGGSASASEILAGAFQEHNIAKLVGQKTFGKGSVQELIPLAGGASLKLTVGEWTTPNGTSISKNGLTPDVVVPMTFEDSQAGKDPQMDSAVGILLKKTP
ncbi:S41 family peptidase [Candidatus Campbellbacteria bacterium]|nr:MAG: S41 family peptidase [Candidatus Campbellbacteria bacterium]